MIYLVSCRPRTEATLRRGTTWATFTRTAAGWLGTPRRPCSVGQRPRSTATWTRSTTWVRKWGGGMGECAGVWGSNETCLICVHVRVCLLVLVCVHACVFCLHDSLCNRKLLDSKALLHTSRPLIFVPDLLRSGVMYAKGRGVERNEAKVGVFFC